MARYGGEPQTVSRRVLLAAMAGETAAIYPVFAVGNLSLLIMREFAVDEALLGATLGWFFVVAGLAAVPGGRVAQRAGPAPALLAGALASAAALAGMALLADRWGHIVAGLTVGALATGLLQQGGTLALAHAIPPSRQGLAFGVKMSASPFTFLVIGLVLPTVALWLGWRAGIALGVLLTVVVAVSVRRSVEPPSVASVARPPRGSGHTSRLAVGAGLGALTSTCVGSFLVPTAIRAGLDIGAAGAVLVTVSVVGLAVRLTSGWLVDRHPGYDVPVMACMLGLGALGCVGLAMARSHAALVVSALLAFGAGWGWPGLLFYAAVRHSPGHAARQASVPQASLMAGAAIGPPLFGLLSSRVSWSSAWLLCACASGVGAAVLRAMPRHPIAPGKARPRAT